jgi:DNA-binding NtrC family response regulator
MAVSQFGLNKVALIVDDEKELRDAILYDFVKRGFKVLTSSNGDEAIEILKSEHVDVVISDIQMPVCDGICLLKRSKLISLEEMPIFLMMSGFSNYSSEQVEELGAIKLISKPIDRKELFSIVEKAINA